MTKIIKNSKSLIKEIQKYKLQRNNIGFVPTLGGLHKAHLELIRLSKKKCHVTVVSIFLNRLQFDSKIDFKNYPMNLISDIKKINKEKVDLLYIPTINEVFPDKKIKKIKASRKANKLCGKYRKGHFDGVITVLKSLFNQVSPNFAFFGLKDFQQILIIKDLILKYKLKIKLNILLEIIYWIISKKKTAYFLFQTIKELFFKAKKNLNKSNSLKLIGKKELIDYGFSKIDYLEFYNENNLSKKNINKNNLRVFVAAFIGQTRLIDNYKK